MAEDKCDQGCQLIIHNSRRRDKWAACTLPINHSLSPVAASSLKKESLLSSYFFKKIYLFIYLGCTGSSFWHSRSLVAVSVLLVAACGT